MKLVFICVLFLGIAFAQNSGPTSIVPHNGVHSGRVFRFKPEIIWFYNTTGVSTEGWLSLDNQARTLFFPNMFNFVSGAPSILKISFDGELLANWTNGLQVGFAEGRNGFLYVWDNYATLTAINLSSGETVWSTVFPTPKAPFRTISPLLWSADESTVYFTNLETIGAVRVSDGTILWNITRPAGANIDFNQYAIPLVHSEIDQTFVVQWSTSTIAKYNYSDGAEQWTYQFPTLNAEPASPSPVIDSNGNIFAVSADGHYVGLDKNGNVLWTGSNTDLYYTFVSPVLMNDSYFFLTDDSIGDIQTISTANGTVTVSFAVQGTELENLSTLSYMLWKDNVLYVVYSSVLAAFDTTDPLNLQLLWTLNTGLSLVGGGGFAVAEDGTMFLAESNFGGFRPALVSIGCPRGQTVNSAGTECVAAPVSVAPLAAPVSEAPTTNVPQSGNAPKGKTSDVSTLTAFFLTKMFFACSLVVAMLV